jgi:hypothetical protein
MAVDSKPQVVVDEETKGSARKVKIHLEPIPVYNPKVNFQSILVFIIFDMFF